MEDKIKLIKGFNLTPDFDYYLDRETSEIYKKGKRGLRKLSKRNRDGRIFYRIVLQGKQFEFNKVKLLAMFKYTNENYRYRMDMRAEADDGSSYNQVTNVKYFYSKENDVEKMSIDDISIGDAYTLFYYKYKDRLDEFLTNGICLLDYSLAAFKMAVRDGYRVYKRCDLSHYVLYETKETLINSDGALLNLEDIRLIIPIDKRSPKDKRRKSEIRYMGTNMRLNVLVYENFYEIMLYKDSRIVFDNEKFDATRLKIR